MLSIILYKLYVQHVYITCYRFNHSFCKHIYNMLITLARVGGGGYSSLFVCVCVCVCVTTKLVFKLNYLKI